MLPIRARLLGTAGVFFLCFAGAPEIPSAGQAAVKIDNFNFTPPTLIIPPGTTVTWTNDDDSPHSVREKDGKFKSAALDTDEKFSQTFAAPGEYEYFCSIHPRMVGKIVVKSMGKTSSN
jgi:plastocyanin